MAQGHIDFAVSRGLTKQQRHKALEAALVDGINDEMADRAVGEYLANPSEPGWVECLRVICADSSQVSARQIVLTIVTLYAEGNASEREAAQWLRRVPRPSWSTLPAHAQDLLEEVDSLWHEHDEGWLHMDSDESLRQALERACKLG